MTDTPTSSTPHVATPAAATPSTDPALTATATGDDTLQMAVPRRQKEMVGASVATEATAASPETAATAAPAEYEAPKELEPDIEKAAERVTQHKVTAPANTVVAVSEMPTEAPRTVAQPVVILPLSEQEMNKAKRKNTQMSVRWLYQWCVRQIQKLKGIVVLYRDNP